MLAAGSAVVCDDDVVCSDMVGLTAATIEVVLAGGFVVAVLLADSDVVVAFEVVDKVVWDLVTTVLVAKLNADASESVELPGASATVCASSRSYTR